MDETISYIATKIGSLDWNRNGQQAEYEFARTTGDICTYTEKITSASQRPHTYVLARRFSLHDLDPTRIEIYKVTVNSPFPDPWGVKLTARDNRKVVDLSAVTTIPGFKPANESTVWLTVTGEDNAMRLALAFQHAMILAGAVAEPFGSLEIKQTTMNVDGPNLISTDRLNRPKGIKTQQRDNRRLIEVTEKEEDGKHFIIFMNLSPENRSISVLVRSANDKVVLQSSPRMPKYTILKQEFDSSEAEPYRVQVTGESAY